MKRGANRLWRTRRGSGGKDGTKKVGQRGGGKGGGGWEVGPRGKRGVRVKGGGSFGRTT